MRIAWTAYTNREFENDIESEVTFSFHVFRNIVKNSNGVYFLARRIECRLYF